MDVDPFPLPGAGDGHDGNAREVPSAAPVLGEAIGRLEAGRLPVRACLREGRLQRIPKTHFHMRPEIFLQLSGRCGFDTPGEAFTLHAGELLIMPAGVPHCEKPKRYRGDYHCLVIMSLPGRINYHFADQGRGGWPRGYGGGAWETEDSEALADWLNRAVEALGEAGTAPGGAGGRACRRSKPPPMARGLILAALGLVAAGAERVERARRGRGGGAGPIRSDVAPGQESTVAESSGAGFKAGADRGTELSPKVRQCRQFVRSSLGDPALSVRRLADSLQCNPDYLSHLFATVMGETLIGYIHRNRLAYAVRLMGQADLNISEIAWAAGFTDVGYFGRLFRRHYGVTPSAYRRRLSAGPADA